MSTTPLAPVYDRLTVDYYNDSGLGLRLFDHHAIGSIDDDDHDDIFSSMKHGADQVQFKQ
ncbi:MAG: hypothetical protein M3H12_03310 [Chromatiales bacterium]